jgi:hypothetical protein
MSGKTKKTDKMFLVSEIHDPSESGIEAIYCCVPITAAEAKDFVQAMLRVEQMTADKGFDQIGPIYGVELWRQADWFTLEADSEKTEKLVEQFDNSEFRYALLPGTPADWGLVESEETSLDLETAIVTDDSVRFRAYYKNDDHQIESHDFPRSLFEKAERGETDEYEGTEGQDRKSYSDDQDRKCYT